MGTRSFLNKPDRRATRDARRHRRGPTACERLEGRLVFSAWTVANLLDAGPGSLREAVDAANAAPGADAIEFAGGLRGTIALASQLDVTDDLTIAGRGEDKIVVSGGGVTRVMSVSGADTELTIRQLTIADGLASVPGGTALGGGLLNNAATVSLDHVTFADNRAVGLNAGGGAVASVGGMLDATHVDFTTNRATSGPGRDCWGGALYVDTGALVAIEHATFSGNSAVGGANGGAAFAADGSQVTLAHCAFDANRAEGTPDLYGAGGAVFAQNLGLLGSSSPTLNVSHCSFTANRAYVRDPGTPGSDTRGQAFGGAFMIEFGPTAVLEYCSFDGNSAEGRSGGTGAPGAAGRLGGVAQGGAVFNVSSTLTLRHTRFTNNLAKAGNGGDGGSGANGAAGNFALGGAVNAGTLTPVNTPPTTTIENCRFEANRAVGGNGGMGGIGGNGGAAGRADGGAVVNLSGTMTIDDSSILDNLAQGGAGGGEGAGGIRGGDGGLSRGGGFAHERGGTTTVSRTYIASNQARGGAGGSARPGGDAVGGGVFNGRPNELPPDPTRPANLTLVNCAILDNLAAGGTGGAGANGGNALGGGILNANPIPVAGTPILALFGTLVSANRALGGTAGAGGATGNGIGGGVYNQAGGVATADVLTLIAGNDASTSDDDVFGTLLVS